MLMPTVYLASRVPDKTRMEAALDTVGQSLCIRHPWGRAISILRTTTY
jgi:hypothetical protein